VVRDDQGCSVQCRRSIDPNRDQYARAAYEECVRRCERQKSKDFEDDTGGNDGYQGRPFW
jgi:hypothetical protein